MLTSARRHVLFLFARSHRAQQRSTLAKCEAVIAGPASECLASEGLAPTLGSAGEGSSAVVGPTHTDPVEFRKRARDLKALSAAKEHTNEERGGGRDPGVRRPGAGRGQLPARSKIFCAATYPIYLHRVIPCAIAQALTTMELVPVPLVPT